MKSGPFLSQALGVGLSATGAVFAQDNPDYCGLTSSLPSPQYNHGVPTEATAKQMAYQRAAQMYP